ncbi:DUF5658 family protein [Nitrosomonas sp.]|uniref:DUF5658 family protein n=1 Tax=Nitrosomonas sp. TaxID=42353 RepID=UPI00260009BD|nr:DUF5658 family protein [Nitrosomonas sp.]MCC6917469.1 hypothetical protein [Nitrosomonas sp.]
MSNQLTVNRRSRERRIRAAFVCPYQLGFKQGRRLVQRRSVRGAAYVDQYDWLLTTCCLAIVLLSAADAFLTVSILTGGGTELNYFMEILIENSTQKFIAFKLALTSLAAILLTIHHEVQIHGGFRCRHLLYMISTGYTCLISYELILLQVIGF